MHGIILGTAMLVSSLGTSSRIEIPRAAVAPTAFTFNLPDIAVTSPGVKGRVRHASSRQVTTAKRFSPTEKVISIAAGVAVGWVVGGTIGFKLTSTSNPYDDTSGLRGMIIGAPVGAGVGAMLGYRLTR